MLMSIDTISRRIDIVRARQRPHAISEIHRVPEKSMSIIEQSSIRPGDDGLANTVVYKLSRLIPAAAAISYPFLLDGFHSAVSPSGEPISAAGMLGAALCLFAAIATPFLGMACAFWMTSATPSSFALRARRLAYFTIGVPPFYVFTGVAVGLLKLYSQLQLSDELVWVVVWSAACIYVMLGSDGEARSVARSAPAAPSVAKWRVAHGVAAALILIYVLFHLTNHLLGLLGPDVHAAVMKMGRQVYRSPFVEPILVTVLLFQVFSGLRLAWRWSSLRTDAFRVFQIGSGAYMAAFILAHLNSAFVAARAVRHIETDWAWATSAPTGLIHSAWSIRLVPHYALGVFFVLAHLSSGLRGVLIAHSVSTTIANRIWAAGLLVSGLVSAAIMSGLCGVRI